MHVAIQHFPDGRYFSGIERIDDRMVAQLRPLNTRHYEESGDERLVLNADWKTYREMQEAGLLRLFLFRIVTRGIVPGSEHPEHGAVIMPTDKLVGYAAFYVHESPHYNGIAQAVADSVFVDRPYRQYAAGFLSWCEEFLAENNGVRVVMVQAPVSHPSAGKFFESRGYAPVEMTYRKFLKEGV